LEDTPPKPNKESTHAPLIKTISDLAYDEINFLLIEGASVVGVSDQDAREVPIVNPTNQLYHRERTMPQDINMWSTDSIRLP
jgi:hypothetical protein